jgi:hypothetical protein
MEAVPARRAHIGKVQAPPHMALFLWPLRVRLGVQADKTERHSMPEIACFLRIAWCSLCRDGYVLKTRSPSQPIKCPRHKITLPNQVMHQVPQNPNDKNHPPKNP